MASIDDLKKIYLVQNLADNALEHLAAIADIHHCAEQEIIFEEGQEAINFYMMTKGKILLRSVITENVTASLGTIKSGYSFGWSSLLDTGSHIAQAIAVEPSEILILDAAKFKSMMDQDHDLGYAIMTGLGRILNNRLHRRTSQFIKTLSQQMEVYQVS